MMDQNAWTGEKTPSVETSVIRKEMNECIRGVVEKLPENYRTVVALSELEGFRDDEIGEILGVSIHTAKIRLHRARARLKKELEAHCNFYRDERNEFASDQKASSNPKNNIQRCILFLPASVYTVKKEVIRREGQKDK